VESFLQHTKRSGGICLGRLGSNERPRKVNSAAMDEVSGIASTARSDPGSGGGLTGEVASAASGAAQKVNLPAMFGRRSEIAASSS
jgi:hypothetical protein